MTPTPAAAPFLRAVVADPDDDLPRLIYADALDAGDSSGVPRDPERAEFIRVQVELARLTVRPLAHVYLGRGDRCNSDVVTGTLGGTPGGVSPGAIVDCVGEPVDPPTPHRWSGVGVVEAVGQNSHGITVTILPRPGVPQDDDRRRRDILRRRERDLLDRHELDWARPVARLLGRSDTWRFTRGFISFVTADAADWLAHADTLLSACPVRGKRYDEKPYYREFSRDGLVRFTTLPEAEELTVGLIDAPPGWRGPARLRDGSPYRDWEELGRPADDRAWRLALLAAEWPGVNFQLPTAVRSDRPNWGTIETTTPRHGTGRGGGPMHTQSPGARLELPPTGVGSERVVPHRRRR